MVGKKTENKAVGRTKGGLNTKIHAIVDGLGNPVAFLLSPGNDNDSTHAIELMNKTDITGSNLLGNVIKLLKQWRGDGRIKEKMMGG